MSYHTSNDAWEKERKCRSIVIGQSTQITGIINPLMITQLMIVKINGQTLARQIRTLQQRVWLCESLELRVWEIETWL